MPGRAEWNSPRGGISNDFSFSNWLALRKSSQTTVAAMKTSTKIFTVAGTLVLTLAFGIVAATPAQEKAFTDKYKAAMEGKDTATLASFLYTQGSDPEALEFYKMMQSGGAGEKFQRLSLLISRRRTLKKRRRRWTDQPAKFA
jgi:hypothetical protein